MVEPFKHESLRQIRCFQDHKSLVAGVTTRQGGHSSKPFDSLNMGLHVRDQGEHVINNRQELADELRIPLEDWVIGEQVHGTEVHVVTRADKGKGVRSHDTAAAGVDGLITNEKDVLLGAFYADCVPLLFVDPHAGWVGIAHAGWKGTVGDMAGEMIRQLVHQGCKRTDIEMVIGPCISQNHYKVDQKVIDQIPQSQHSLTVTDLGAGQFLLDLKKLNERFAVQAGLAESQIKQTRFCTYEKEELFFSHRRDQGKTGRMLGFIGWKS
ncbi:peptidoglycan editing factor PgeF [Halobacillus yeomjeoni]|uniref:Purine nucleoside phosphorylase n=1 Tax=Halobacillus yeomjeoni TaxID=311194 RepID=A0A931MU29_9BACI|nr:peptidoglycan editing factor PgeF [Halobacillus yeomjeoni]MBH0229066.1 peptidoglycan editing factor PgeF [Halobacillus yeomjeoni]